MPPPINSSRVPWPGSMLPAPPSRRFFTMNSNGSAQNALFFFFFVFACLSETIDDHTWDFVLLRIIAEGFLGASKRGISVKDVQALLRKYGFRVERQSVRRLMTVGVGHNGSAVVGHWPTVA